MPPPSSIPLSKKRKLAPAPTTSRGQTSPSPSLSTPSLPEDDEYDPGPSRPPPRVTKRKATETGGTAKAKGKAPSREALRKANHSLIERRRREKINAALSELRSMVPGLGEDGGKGGEFKLEVLERTVAHMKELKGRLAQLEGTVGSTSTTGESSRHRNASANRDSTSRSYNDSNEEAEDEELAGQITPAPFVLPSSQRLSPYPSPSPDKLQSQLATPDPNETDVESNLPPPLAKATRLSSTSSSKSNSPLAAPAPSVASLLASAHQQHHRQPIPPSSRPPPPPQASNPIFLPFPAPSPTSPFINPSMTSSHSASSSSSALPDPSPFLAPLQNIGLFGGVFNLDATSPADTLRTSEKQPSPPDFALPPSSNKRHSPTNSSSGTAKDMAPEEAANLLLAFSSPDTLRPQQVVIINPGGSGGRRRRLTLETDDFSLDQGSGVKVEEMVGKSAKDILRMTDFQR